VKSRLVSRWVPLLALALMTSACEGLPSSNLLSEAKRLAGSQLAQDLLANLQTVSTFDYNSLDGLSFTTQALPGQIGPSAAGGPGARVPMKPGAPKPPAFQQGIAKMKQGMEKLDRLKSRIKPGPEQDLESEKQIGGQKVREQLRKRAVPRGKSSEAHELTRTLDEDGSPLKVEGKASRELDKGAFKADFERVFNEDGSVDSTYSAVVTRKSDGATRKVVWVRRHEADGSMSGTGTITKFDGTQVTVNLSRDAAGKHSIEASDAKAGVGVALGQDDSSSRATSVVTDLESKKSEPSELDADAAEPAVE
jgi:hypothetical protein